MSALLAVLSLAKLGKAATTLVTMLISLAVYAQIFGWPYAAGFIAMLFVHELGHYVAARQRGLEVGAPTFIPFVGAWIQLKDEAMDVETEAYVAAAGPFVGTLAALAAYGLARSLDSPLLLAIAYAGFALNLFNLLPVPPLDGGRMTRILSPKIWFAGVPLLVALFLYNPSPMLVLIACLAVPHVWSAWKGEASDPRPSPDSATRMEYAALYLGLVAFLGLMTFSLHETLQRATPALR